jgi:hypothetical protein
LIFFSLWTRAAAAVEYTSASHCTNNLTARLTLWPTSRYFQAAGAHPLPDADSVQATSLTTKDGEPMTTHVWSAVLTVLVVVPIPDRGFDGGQLAEHEIVPLNQLGSITL